MLRAGVGEAARNPAVRAALVAVAVIGGLDAVDEYFPLLARDWGVATPAIPGAMVAIALAGAAGAALGGAASRLRPRTLAAILALAVAGFCAAALVHRPLAVAGMALAYGLYRLVLVVTDARLQHRIEGPSRATVTSVASLGTELTAAVFVAAWAVDRPWLVALIALGAAAALPRLLRAGPRASEPAGGRVGIEGGGHRYAVDVDGRGRGRILVVDDEDDVRALLTRYLELEGYQVDQAADAQSVYQAMADNPPDLVLLDVMLSPDDGLEVLSRIRRDGDVAVILLTGKGAEADRIVGLKLGADDYVVKPFSPAEVEARIASVLRRVKPPSTPSLSFDGLSIELATREVRVRGELVALTAKEFDLLVFLASSPRQVFSRDQLLDQVWNSSPEWQSPGTVTEHIRRLRNRIEVDAEAPRWITTVWGVGYRFNPVGPRCRTEVFRP